jgi:hypothetical protein
VLNALMNVYKAMGGGWVDTADAKTAPPVRASPMSVAKP